MARLRAEDAAKRRASGHGPDFLEALARGLVVIRAFMPERVTERMVTDKPALKTAILEVRRLGYSITEQEVRRGDRAVACPIRKFDGMVVAAPCAATWVEDGDQARPEAHVAALRAETDALPAQLI
ncbi:MAG: IclR family transcriptional regulator C-terminal domain-containing protein [Alphaproteobacteria bacterium]